MILTPKNINSSSEIEAQEAIEYLLQDTLSKGNIKSIFETIKSFLCDTTNNLTRLHIVTMLINILDIMPLFSKELNGLNYKVFRNDPGFELYKDDFHFPLREIAKHNLTNEEIDLFFELLSQFQTVANILLEHAFQEKNNELRTKILEAIVHSAYIHNTIHIQNLDTNLFNGLKNHPNTTKAYFFYIINKDKELSILIQKELSKDNKGKTGKIYNIIGKEIIYLWPILSYILKLNTKQFNCFLRKLALTVKKGTAKIIKNFEYLETDHPFAHFALCCNYFIPETKQLIYDKKISKDFYDYIKNNNLNISPLINIHDDEQILNLINEFKKTFTINEINKNFDSRLREQIGYSFKDILNNLEIIHIYKDEIEKVLTSNKRFNKNFKGFINNAAASIAIEHIPDTEIEHAEDLRKWLRQIIEENDLKEIEFNRYSLNKPEVFNEFIKKNLKNHKNITEKKRKFYVSKLISLMDSAGVDTLYFNHLTVTHPVLFEQYIKNIIDIDKIYFEKELQNLRMTILTTLQHYHVVDLYPEVRAAQSFKAILIAYLQEKKPLRPEFLLRDENLLAHTKEIADCTKHSKVRNAYDQAGIGFYKVPCRTLYPGLQTILFHTDKLFAKTRVVIGTQNIKGKTEPIFIVDTFEVIVDKREKKKDSLTSSLNYILSYYYEFTQILKFLKSLAQKMNIPKTYIMPEAIISHWVKNYAVKSLEKSERLELNRDFFESDVKRIIKNISPQLDFTLPQITAVLLYQKVYRDKLYILREAVKFCPKKDKKTILNFIKDKFEATYDLPYKALKNYFSDDEIYKMVIENVKYITLKVF